VTECANELQKTVYDNRHQHQLSQVLAQRLFHYK